MNRHQISQALRLETPCLLDRFPCIKPFIISLKTYYYFNNASLPQNFSGQLNLLSPGLSIGCVYFFHCWTRSVMLHSLYLYICHWLVVWNIFYFPIYWE